MNQTEGVRSQETESRQLAECAPQIESHSVHIVHIVHIVHSPTSNCRALQSLTPATARAWRAAASGSLRRRP